ncbi:MAG: hypothetical protein NVSMB68_05240 [Thermoanaerobaculia bacterium]
MWIDTQGGFMRRNEQPWGLVMLMTLSFSGVLAVIAGIAARVLMLALEFGLLLKILGS